MIQTGNAQVVRLIDCLRRQSSPKWVGIAEMDMAMADSNVSTAEVPKPSLGDDSGAW